MMKKLVNYARFYALLKQVASHSSSDCAKEALIEQHTAGRTTSLREMTSAEYETMCDDMQRAISGDGIYIEDYRAMIKPLRSAVLKRLQKIGIDTTDFSAVDAFLCNSRLVGQRFAQLTPSELRALVPKLEAIRGKERREKPTTTPSPAAPRVIIPMMMPKNQLPS